MDFGSLLARARLARGVLQRDLAVRVGVRGETLSAWETGRTRPDVEQLAALCRVLHVSADVLLGRRPFELGPMPEASQSCSACGEVHEAGPCPGDPPAPTRELVRAPGPPAIAGVDYRRRKKGST